MPAHKASKRRRRKPEPDDIVMLLPGGDVLQRKDMAKHKKTKAPAPVTPMEFVGAQMANFLYGLANNSEVPGDVRIYAKELQLKWDSISRFTLNNPIVSMELEAKLFPKKKSARA